MSNVHSFHLHVLSVRLDQRRPTVHQQLLGLAADLRALSLQEPDPAELAALATWAELIAGRVEREGLR
ncbi:hypothetical protein [Azospirillum brasilense]|uniref:hypothetical protein n=1 Tax=Azospirillum brasilense TaxID=192 RepID=UPI001EDAD29C|nr:hypothetical protein [Azospirillum brasilense]UKJ74516.1 hypothetical protein H1Q64_18330 [Azospirillum brasilense]